MSRERADGDGERSDAGEQTPTAGSAISVDDAVVTVPEPVLAQYRRYTAYNSPYAAHDRGCAVDLYPMDGTAPSPVAGEVIATETVRAPPKPYAPAEDHLVVVDCGPIVARIMHVDPAVEVGDRVSTGDDLGDLVRAGFFARWVPNHLHVGFRRHDENHLRAGGSLPLELGVDPTPVGWDGRGTVVDADETYALLDAPSVPDDGFCGLAARVGDGESDDERAGERSDRHRSAGEQVVLDGGFQHYDCGGVHPAGDVRDVGSGDATGPVHVLGTHVGDAVASAGSTNDVAWRPVTVHANGDPVHGISLYCGQRGDFAVKIVGEDHGLEAGDPVEVTLDPAFAE